jgi:hypothetical protein
VPPPTQKPSIEGQNSRQVVIIGYHAAKKELGIVLKYRRGHSWKPPLNVNVFDDFDLQDAAQFNEAFKLAQRLIGASEPPQMLEAVVEEPEAVEVEAAEDRGNRPKSFRKF